LNKGTDGKAEAGPQPGEETEQLPSTKFSTKI